MAGAGPKSLAATIAKVIGPVVARRGKALAVILAEWERIVGPELAAVSQPLRLGAEARSPRAGEPAGAVLVIEVTGAAATELQHQGPMVIDRINGFLGMAAIERLRLVHGAGRPAKPAPPLALLDAGAERAVADAVASVESPELKAALARFGRTLTALADRR